jgi:nitrogen fixation protein NifX
MIRTRRLQLVSENEREGYFMKVAFASNDKVHVNAHFGQAEEFAIWDIGPDEASFTGVIQVKAEDDMEGHSDDKIEARGAALEECALVYVGEIGGPAAARLVAKKIHPIKSKEREPITVVVEKLQEVLKGNPPPWLRKAMMKNERPGTAV